MTYDLGGTPPPVPVQTVAYFVAAEAVTNTLKHSGATRAAIRVTGRHDGIVIHIEDNGTGGAPTVPPPAASSASPAASPPSTAT